MQSRILRKKNNLYRLDSSRRRCQIANESTERLSKFEPFHLTYRITNKSTSSMGGRVWIRYKKAKSFISKV
jgi:hypothetical protein